MRHQQENKPNKGFKRAYRAGVVVVLILSALISWISVAIISSVDGKINKKNHHIEETQEELVDKQDTVFVEKTKEVIVRDTVYRYVQPAVPAKPKPEESVAPKRDTLSK
jgi:cell division protein FtsL